MGGDGHKRLRVHDQSEPLKPFMLSWMCQILVGDIGKMFGADSRDTYNVSEICKN
ncbi:MAG: hypothetical protein IS860_08620 [Nitrosopumilus sp.]|nr:hypothetical protein [Nitrosopumilus sp.]MCE2506218.1 hypothetical protein [Nitrosopumilaceae archaeon]